MLQPILGNTYWYNVWNLPKNRGTIRDPKASKICGLPVRNCNLVFRLDRFSHQLRVQFRIQKGAYDSIVNELRRGEEHIDSMRDLLLGKWIKDSIKDKETWLLVVAVEINTENVPSTKKRYSSKKQEIFGAKVSSIKHFRMQLLTFSRHPLFIITIFKQAVAFAISQSALMNALPLGVEVMTERNQFGALLHPSLYRDIAISCMYLVDDIIDDVVHTDEVPPFTQAVPLQADKQSDLTTFKKAKTTFKPERKSDFTTGVYEASVRKIRNVPGFPNARQKVTNMLEREEDVYQHHETMYILRCLETACTSLSLCTGLDHYESALINSILLDDFEYDGFKVMRNKINLLIVCESFLMNLNATI